MVFLNDVEEGGECAFPVADNATFSWKVNKQKHSSFQNISNLIRAINRNLTRSRKSFSTIQFVKLSLIRGGVDILLHA